MGRRSRTPGNPSRQFSHSSREKDGAPKLILDWSPRGSGSIAGLYAGQEHTIAGQQVWVYDKTSGGGATTSTFELTTSGIHVVHTGGSGDTTAMRLVLTDSGRFPGADLARGSICCTASFTVASLNNTSSNLTLALEQEPRGDKPNEDHVQYDCWVQAFRQSSSDWRVRGVRSTGASAQSIVNYGADSLSGSEPSNVRLTLYGTNWSFFAGGDTTAGPGTFQGVGLGSNQLRMINAHGSGVTVHTGVSYPIVAIMFGRGDSTPVDVTLTNLRVWTYGYIA